MSVVLLAAPSSLEASLVFLLLLFALFGGDGSVFIDGAEQELGQEDHEGRGCHGCPSDYVLPEGFSTAEEASGEVAVSPPRGAHTTSYTIPQLTTPI